jgi:hypothetical protein
MTTSFSGGSRLFGSLPRIGTWKVFQGPSDGRKFSQMWGCRRVLQQWGLKMNKSAWQSSLRMVRNVRSHFVVSCWVLCMQDSSCSGRWKMKRYQWPFDSMPVTHYVGYCMNELHLQFLPWHSGFTTIQSQWHYLQYSSDNNRSMTNYLIKWRWLTLQHLKS